MRDAPGFGFWWIDFDLTGKYTHRTISGGVGHNLPQEAPERLVDAVLEVDGSSA